MTRKTKIILLAGISLVVGGYAAQAVVHEFNQKIMDAKTVRKAQAIAMRKEYVKFDETNHSYNNENGQRVFRQPGDEDWRVYFKIIDFDGFNEEIRDRLLKAEARRVEAGNLRFTILSKEHYEMTDIGDSFTVNCQRFADDTLMTFGAFNLQ